jgi:hemolysin D
VPVPGQVPRVIVPKDAQVTAEVVVDHKDIGFVGAGQAAAIKLETFPFTRYGTVPATVKSVVADAVNDEKTRAIFPVVLSLTQADVGVWSCLLPPSSSRHSCSADSSADGQGSVKG